LPYILSSEKLGCQLHPIPPNQLDQQLLQALKHKSSTIKTFGPFFNLPRAILR